MKSVGLPNLKFSTPATLFSSILPTLVAERDGFLWKSQFFIVFDDVSHIAVLPLLPVALDEPPKTGWVAILLFLDRPLS